MDVVPLALGSVESGFFLFSSQPIMYPYVMHVFAGLRFVIAPHMKNITT